MTRTIQCVATALTFALCGSVLGEIIIQNGSLEGYAGEVSYFDIELDQFDTQGGALELNFVQFDFVTGFSGGGQSNDGGGQPTRIRVTLAADYFLDGQSLAETEAEVRLKITHDEPRFFTFFDSDEVNVTVNEQAGLAPWIGAGKIIMGAEVLMVILENPAGSTGVGAGGVVRYTVTYDYSVAGPSTVTTVEDFEDFTNDSAWGWGTGGEYIESANGNPGAFLRDPTLSSCCPVLYTAPVGDNEFTGDYRARGVTSVGVDLITLDAGFGIGSRPLTLLLANDAGTPDNYDDDLWAWYVGTLEVPQAGVPRDLLTPPGWTEFDFEVPADALTVPDGWQTLGAEGMTDDEIWNGVMTGVDSVEFWYGAPGTIHLFNSWDVGADNMRITTATEGTIFGDLNGDGVIDRDDFHIIVQHFGLCEGCPSDLNGDGVVDHQDLWILLTIWNGYVAADHLL